MKKQIALVTGASSGIGKALSYGLAKRGWVVIGVARSGDKLSQIKEDLHDKFLPLVCDVGIKEEIQKCSRQILEQGIVPSLFFLNAGLLGDISFEDPDHFDLSIHEQVMRVNYFGALAWVECWEKPCKQNNGAHFIATSSINAIFAPPKKSAYSASKAALARAFESLSLTYFGTNLKFSVVYPGPVDTPGLKGNPPFTWSAEKMAERMIDFAFSGRKSYEPSLFYKIGTRLLRRLPEKWVVKIFNRFQHPHH